MFSIPHMIVIFVIVLVVFGPQKLPELARSLGKLMAEFRKASADFKGAFEQEMRELERQAREIERKKAADAAAKATEQEPMQAATLATPSGVETPALSENTTADVASITAANEGEGMRLTEAAPELTVTPVAESVPRSNILTEPADAFESGNEPMRMQESGSPKDAKIASEEAVKRANNGDGAGTTTSAADNIEVPHGQQPA